jgi:hypothetical protein
MTKAKQVSAAMAEYCSMKQSNTADLSNSPATSVNTGNDVTHTLPQNKMYIISYHKTTDTNGWLHDGKCNDKLTGMNPNMQIHPVILSWLADNSEIEIGSNQESINCYTEMKSRMHLFPAMVLGRINQRTIVFD